MQQENEQTAKSQSCVRKVKGDSSRVAWLLLIVCIVFCIISSVICMVLWYNSAYSNSLVDIVQGGKSSLQLEIEDSSTVEDSFDFPLSVRARSLTAATLITEHKQGCQEHACRIECSASEDIYAETAAVMNGSECDVFAGLRVTNQHAKSMTDHWLDLNTSVLQILIESSQFKSIKSGAFNSPMFAQLFHMAWFDLKLERVDHGALLGLYSLRKLEIVFELPGISMSFLQPVQRTLTHLRINCGIVFKTDSPDFEYIFMPNLIHLDLSWNSFSGSLSRNLFKGTPNVTYLYLRNCRISAIEDDAFADLAEKLRLLDLTKNSLTHISADVFQRVETQLLFDLDANPWHCSCELLSLIDFFDKHKNLFISQPYCRTPLSFYGRSFDNLSALDLGCGTPIRLQEMQSELETTLQWIAATTEITSFTSSYTDEAEKARETQDKQTFQLPCAEAIDLEAVGSLEAGTAENNKHKKSSYSGKLAFLVPNIDLQLELFENGSVRATIDEYDEATHLNIIWFTDDVDVARIRLTQSPRDYNCMQYEQPQLMIEQVQRNHTYTFCMLPADELLISPLFCQPLHVPLKMDSNDDGDADTWIGENDRNFTIAMLCLIFFVSIVIGAIFAYLGIKSFPQLLEGSKNVLVIKESDRSRYVATIADSEYIQPNKCNKQISEIYARSSVSKLPSIVSTSTVFEDSFYQADAQSFDYEMPIKYTNELPELCHKDTQLNRPNTPPPLPKRNSSLSLKLDQKPKDSQAV